MLSQHVPSGEKQSGEAGVVQNVLNITRLQCCKSTHQPKKCDLAHQTLFPHERVGSGNETKNSLLQWQECMSNCHCLS